MKLIRINLVRGSDGFSLQILNDNGSGYRIAGPKAWGNPYNKPTAEFVLDVDELIETINKLAYEIECSDNNE